MPTNVKRQRARWERDRRDDQDAALAIHELRAALGRVEALANAASTSLEDLPFVCDAARRSRAGRLYYLVKETAAVATETLEAADRRMTDRGSSRLPRGRR